MQQFIAYLAFDGDCADAMRFYERALDGKLHALLKNGDTPAAEHVPPGNADRIMHAYLTVDGGALMAGDALVGQYEGKKGFSLTLNYESNEQAERVFAKLSEGGRVTMPMSPSFWAERFGMCVDKFGTAWIVNGKMIPMQPQ